MMKSDPHYERLRDPRDKEIERLRDALECVKRNTETRHIETLRAAKENMRAAWIAANAALVPPNAALCHPAGDAGGAHGNQSKNYEHES